MALQTVHSFLPVFTLNANLLHGKIKASNRPKFCLKLSLVSHGYNNTDVDEGGGGKTNNSPKESTQLKQESRNLYGGQILD